MALNALSSIWLPNCSQFFILYKSFASGRIGIPSGLIFASEGKPICVEGKLAISRLLSIPILANFCPNYLPIFIIFKSFPSGHIGFPSGLSFASEEKPTRIERKLAYFLSQFLPTFYINYSPTFMLFKSFTSEHIGFALGLIFASEWKPTRAKRNLANSRTPSMPILANFLSQLSPDFLSFQKFHLGAYWIPLRASVLLQRETCVRQ